MQPPTHEGDVVALDMRNQTCTLRLVGSRSEYRIDGGDVFRLRPTGSVDCYICKDKRRPDEMQGLSCCPNKLCLECVDKLEEPECPFCRAAW